MYNGSSNWFDIENKLGRHEELLREAEKARLVKSLKVDRKSQSALKVAILGWLGVQLVRWGAHLQERASSQPTVNLDKICY